MVREPDAGKQCGIGGGAVIGHPVVLGHQPVQVGQRPGRSVGRRGVGAKPGMGRVLAQRHPQGGDLIGGQEAMIASDALIGQRRDPVPLIGLHPVHDGRPRAARHDLDLGSGIAETIQPDGLQPRSIATVVGRVIGRQ